MHMQNRAALFDLDGVLVDTEGIYYNFWNDIDQIYPTGIDDFASYIKGSTLKKIMAYYPDQKVRDDIVLRLEKHERNMRYRIFDGVIDFLNQLHDASIKCAIVTSSNEEKMERLFAQNPGFKDYFTVIVCDCHVKNSKPNPEGYLLAADKLGCKPSECFVFEDSFSGLEAGRRSGAKVIALATTNTHESLEDKADMVIDSFVGLTLETLKKLAVSKL